MRKVIAWYKQSSFTTRLCLILWAVFLLSLLPLLVIGMYNHPAGDDFAYGLNAHLAWESSHSLWAAIKAAAATVKSYYTSWQGTYSSIFLMSLQPAVISERLYALTTPLMLGMLPAL